MRGLVRLVIVGSLLLGCVDAFADLSAQGGQIVEGVPIKTLTVTTSTDSAGNFGARSTILGFKLLATSAFAYCSLYDAATVTGTQFDELSEGTADESQVHIWPSPYQLTTDLSISVGNGICIVYYQ